MVGLVSSITRYPVKSMKGEQVLQTKVMSYGLYGDRSHVMMDETRPGKFFTITQFPPLVKYEAKFAGEEKEDVYPILNINSPEGRTFQWNDEELKKELETSSGRNIAFTSHTPEYVPFGAIEEENILLITDASLQELAETYGKEAVAARFRPNLIIDLKEHQPYAEEQWIGKRLRIGREVVIEVKRTCDRCMIITVDPETGEQDPKLLKTVVQERNNQFGVYCSVIETGVIEEGDTVKLIDP